MDRGCTARGSRSSDYPHVVAAFNSAFRLDNSGGGYYAEGRTVQALVPGRASFVTYADGHVDVGVWGRDDNMAPGVTAVRQNLGLIVDGGAVVPGLADANSSQWGGTVGNKIYVWRSGVGVDARGDLVYAAGPGLNVATLAEILRRAGCVRAMELDINTWWVSLSVYTPDAHGGLQPSNLLPSMVRPPDRYLSDSTRDFIEVDTRGNSGGRATRECSGAGASRSASSSWSPSSASLPSARGGGSPGRPASVKSRTTHDTQLAAGDPSVPPGPLVDRRPRATTA